MDFDINESDVILFSRGRGRGHAIPDMVILEELRRIAPHLRVSVCTYGTGLRTFHQMGQPAFDLGLPDECNPWEVAQKAGRVLRDANSPLVLSHEEFSVIPIAQIFGLPTVFLITWFAPQNLMLMQALVGVDHVLFIEEQGHFPEPDYLKGKIQYIGPVLRRFRYLPGERHRVRMELGASADEAILLLLPGTACGWPEPVYDMILQAFEALPRKRKRLIWMAGEEFGKVAAKCSGRANIVVQRADSCPERFMVASDVALTSGTYNIGRELSALGVPSISLSLGKNSVDDYFSRCLPHNTFFYVGDTSAVQLMQCMEAGLERGCSSPEPSAMDGSKATKAANSLLELIYFHKPSLRLINCKNGRD